MIRKNFFVSAAAATALAIGFVTPASASTFSNNSVTSGPDNGSWNFDLTSLSFSSYDDDIWSGDTWDSSEIVFYGANDGTETTLNCADPADLSDASDGSGDKILTCDPVEIDNGEGVLTVTAELRFYASYSIVRERLIISNETDVATDIQAVKFNFNSYQDNRTQLSWALGYGILDDWSGAAPIPGSGLATGYDDLSWATDDRQDQQSSPVVKYSVGRADSASLPLNDAERGFVSGGHAGYYDSANDDSNSYFEIPALAPAESIEFMVFVQQFSVDDNVTPDGSLSAWETGTRDAIIAADADSALTDDEVIFAGIDDVSRVLNWSPAAEEESTPLANTGFDAASMGTIALFALAGGVALFSRRRRAVK